MGLWTFFRVPDSEALTMCNIYVQYYNETIYDTVSFDITHRIPKLKKV